MLKMSSRVLIALFAVFVSVSPNPMMQRALNLCPIHGNLPFDRPLQLTQKPIPPAATCNPCSTPVNDANQIIVKKLLSNPVVQAIVDQNRQNLPTHGPPHHIVNNYFIIPSEVLLNETKKAEVNRVKVRPRDLCEPKNCRRQFGDRVQQKAQNPNRRPPIRQGERRLEGKRPSDYESSEPQCRLIVRNDHDKCIKDNLNTGRGDEVRKCLDLPEKTRDFYDIFEPDDDEVCRPQIKRSDISNINRDDDGQAEMFHENYEERREPRNKNRDDRRPMLRQSPNKPPLIEDTNLNSKRKEVPLLNAEMINGHNIQNSGMNRNPSRSKNIQNSNAALSNSGSNNEATKGRVTRNPMDEAIITDAKRNFPGISETLIRQLLHDVKRQITTQNHQMRNHPHNQHPMFNNNYYNQRPPQNWYPNHMQHHPSMRSGYNGTNHFPNRPGPYGKTRRDPNKPKKNKKSKPKSNGDNTTNAVDNPMNTSAVTDISNKTVTVSSNSNETHIEVTEIPNVNTKNSELDINSSRGQEIDAPKPKTFDNTTPYVRNAYPDSRLRKLGEEDELPNIGENGIFYDDYYPDFTRDNKAYSFDDDFYEYYDEDMHRAERKTQPHQGRVPNSNVERLHRIEGTRNSRKRIFGKNTDKQQEVPNPMEEESSELIYKTPPGLEAPDFETFKVNRDPHEGLRPKYYDADDFPVFKVEDPDSTTEEVVAKLSTYSHAKSPTYYFSSTPPANTLKRTKPKSENIETDYANSKIVKYHTQDYSAEEASSTQRSDKVEKDMDDEKNQYAKDGDTTIVIAKSLGYPEK